MDRSCFEWLGVSRRCKSSRRASRDSYSRACRQTQPSYCCCAACSCPAAAEAAVALYVAACLLCCRSLGQLHVCASRLEQPPSAAPTTPQPPSPPSASTAAAAAAAASAAIPSSSASFASTKVSTSYLVPQAAVRAAAAAGRGGDPCLALSRALVTLPGSVLWFTVPSRVAACLDSFPFNPAVDLPFLNSLVYALDTFYVYRYIAVSSPDPVNLPSRWDVVAELRALRANATRRWKTARSFHDAVVRVVDRLHDGHTGVFPRCFKSFVYFLPLPVVAVVEGGRYKIRVAPSGVASPGLLNAGRYYGFDASPYLGAEVRRIGNRPALEAVLDYANRTLGTYHDVGARFNLALARLSPEVGGGFFSEGGVSVTRSSGAFVQRDVLPPADRMAYTLVRKGSLREEVVSAPWMATWVGDGSVRFNSRSSYWSTYCKASPGLPAVASASGSAAGLEVVTGTGARSQQGGSTDNNGSSSSSSSGSGSGGGGGGGGGGGFGGKVPVFGSTALQARRMYRPSLDLELPELTVSEQGAVFSRVDSVPSPVQQPRQAAAAAATVTTLSAWDDLWQVFKLGDGATVVITIPTFAPPANTVTDSIAQFMLATNKAFALARRHGRRVLLDVRGNPGGLALLPWWLSRQILGSARVPRSQATAPVDFRVGSPLVLQLVQQSVWLYNYTNYADLNQNPISPRVGSRFVFPMRDVRWGKGGRKGRYSALLKLVDMSFYTSRPVAPQLGNMPVAVLTNGLCFSACAIFTHNLKKRYGVRHVTVGGWPGRPLSLSGSCLGFTLGDYEGELMASLPRSRKPNPLLSYRFPYQAKLGMAFASGYIGGNTPCEWEFLKGDAQLQPTTAMLSQQGLLWNAAAKVAFLTK